MTHQRAVHPDGTPERLGRYRLLRPISTGGMARVFEGRRESLAGIAPRVAIKVILPDFAAEASFRELFVNEARIGSMLHHQNLVQIQDFDCEGQLYYLVMEYVEGVTLRRAISLSRRHGLQPSLSVVAELGRQVCDGLQYAHAATAEDGHPLGLVHRDIKPSNLMLNPQGVVKVLDFGISKALTSRERAGAVRGTWGYMAPEQAEGGVVSGVADLFGLAAVLYEAACGRALFPEKEPGEIRGLLSADAAARRASRLTGPMRPLGGVLVRALQRDPAARFSSAGAMARALSALVSDPVTARDEVVRFQQTVATLARPPGSSGSSGSPGSAGSPGALADPWHSAASMGASAGPGPRGATPAPHHRAPASAAAHAGPGLPVAIGGPPPSAAPWRAPGRAPAPGPAPGGGRWKTGLAALFALAALVIVAFTGWHVVGGPSAQQPASADQAAPANPLEGLGEDAAAEAATDQAPGAEQTLAAEPEARAAEPEARARAPRGPAPAPSSPAPSSPAPSSPAPASPEAGSEPPARIQPVAADRAGADPAGEPAPSEPAPSEPAPSEPAPSESAPAQPVAPASGQPVAPAPAGSAAPIAAPVPSRRGRLTISSIPRSQVIVDGRFVRYTPLFQHDVDGGARMVTLITDDGRRTSFSVEVPGGGEARRVWSFDEGRFIQR